MHWFSSCRDESFPGFLKNHDIRYSRKGNFKSLETSQHLYHPEIIIYFPLSFTSQQVLKSLGKVLKSCYCLLRYLINILKTKYINQKFESQVLLKNIL